MTKTASHQLPDFDLAAPLGFDPAAFDMRLPLARFILLLAAVFNDLKSAWYLVERLRAVEPIAAYSLASKGQVAGMSLQNVRLIAGVLHELMVVIEKHRDLVESSDFKALMRKLTGSPRIAWNQVQHIAFAQDRAPNVSGADSLLLIKIRNNLAFHYGVKMLPSAYRVTFADRAKPFRSHAVISDGDSMEGTRFYFADAAMEEGLRSATGLSIDDLSRRISRISADVNIALKSIVVRYVRDVAKLSRYQP